MRILGTDFPFLLERRIRRGKRQPWPGSSLSLLQATRPVTSWRARAEPLPLNGGGCGRRGGSGDGSSRAGAAAPRPGPAMSHCRQEGKDKIIFVTKEDHEMPSSAELIADDPNDPYEDQGLILPNGDINWNCPCLGGMASGPCGEQFKSAFSCFHYSSEEIKGSDCVEQFRAMQECMQKYPDLYPQDDEEDRQSNDAEIPSQSREDNPGEEKTFS